MDDQNYVQDDDVVHDPRYYGSVSQPLPGASADRIAVGGFKANLPVAELLDTEWGSGTTTTRRGYA